MTKTAPCAACRDETTGHRVSGRDGRYCLTCFNELEHGQVRNQNISICGGTRGSMDPDIGSYRTNAVRYLEDGDRR